MTTLQALFMFVILSLATSEASGAGNEPFVPVTENLNTLPTLQRHLGVANPPASGAHGEDAARYAELFKQDVVIDGGVHGVSGTCVSSAFGTVAYTNSGNRLFQPAAAINYATLGCNCNNPGSDVAHVIASASQSAALGNYQRVAGTDYFVNCTDSEAGALPDDSTALLRVDILNGALYAVNNIARHSLLPSESSVGTLYASQYGVACDGVTDETANIQRLIDQLGAAQGGKLILPRGTCPVDSLHMRSRVALEGAGKNITILSMVAHATTHHPVVNMGDSGVVGVGAPAGLGIGRVTGASIRHLTINGNKSTQTGGAPLDQYSPCISIWGSNDNIVEHTELYDCHGDGVTIGYGIGRHEGSDRNIIRHNIMYNNSRTAIAITFGDENVLEYNKASGIFDLELDPATVSSLKKNIVTGNTGRTGSAKSSDLAISLASLNINKNQYFGNIVSNNIIFALNMSYNRHTIITGNIIVASNSTDERLISMDASDDTVICNNMFVANTAVATALQELIRVRASSGLTLCNNNVDNDNVRFTFFISTFGADPPAFGHRIYGNIIRGTGAYKSGEIERPSEEAILRVRASGGTPQVITIAQLTGTPLFSGACSGQLPLNCGQLAFGPSGANLLIGFEAGGAPWIIEALTYGEVGTENEPYFYYFALGVDIIGSNRVIAVHSAPGGVPDPLWSPFVFSSGGSKGTFFLKIYY